jgi:uncharacterized hydrophobic protein (TIGR00271 family)
LDRAYLALLVAAGLVASLGLEQNSVATIIGAMVVAPLMLPIRALGYGLLRMDGRIIGSSLTTLILSVVITVSLGVLIGRLSGRPEFGSEILSRTSITFLGLTVAIVGGTLAGLSRTEWDSKITDSLIGVGIAVSLVPPLCTVGITLAYGANFESWGALSIFLTNAVGISLACLIAFWATGYGPEAVWKIGVALAAYAVAIGGLSPELARTGVRAREQSRVESLLRERVRAYIQQAIEVESIDISWKEQPYDVVAVVRSPTPPTRDQVRSLADALNRDAEQPLRLTVVEDPAVRVTP